MAHNPNNQNIHCSVESCRYHAVSGCCSLADIQVAPKPNISSKQQDESLCSSYKCKA
jgi:Domain of Unknown Function (DUF1540).